MCQVWEPGSDANNIGHFVGVLLLSIPFVALSHSASVLFVCYWDLLSQLA